MTNLISLYFINCQKIKDLQVCKNISKYWELNDAINKQRIHKVLFNDGLGIVPERREALTNNLNHIFNLFKEISSDCKDDKKILADSFADFYAPVAGIEANSNFLRDYYQVVELYDYLHNPNLYQAHL